MYVPAASQVCLTYGLEGTRARAYDTKLTSLTFLRLSVLRKLSMLKVVLLLACPVS